MIYHLFFWMYTKLQQKPPLYMSFFWFSTNLTSTFQYNSSCSFCVSHSDILFPQDLFTCHLHRSWEQSWKTLEKAFLLELSLSVITAFVSKLGLEQLFIIVWKKAISTSSYFLLHMWWAMGYPSLNSSGTRFINGNLYWFGLSVYQCIRFYVLAFKIFLFAPLFEIQTQICCSSSQYRRTFLVLSVFFPWKLRVELYYSLLVATLSTSRKWKCYHLNASVSCNLQPSVSY